MIEEDDGATVDHSRGDDCWPREEAKGDRKIKRRNGDGDRREGKTKEKMMPRERGRRDEMG